MRLPQAAVYEVATFYSHFDVVKEGETPPPADDHTGLQFDHLRAQGSGGAARCAQDQDRIRRRCACCARPAWDDAIRHRFAKLDIFTSITPRLDPWRPYCEAGTASPRFPLIKISPSIWRTGGYSVLESCRSGRRDFDQIVSELTDAGLRGLGGAGFPTGRKWKIVRGYPAPRLMTINGDEGEPGTFKDRFYLEREPHRMFEGALIAAWAVEAERIYLYMRDEYPAVLHILAQEIAALEDAGIIHKDQIELRRGAGAYICGEESAMIESIEGKRGYPRNRPPYIAEVGLFGRPTLNQNVETLYWVPEILAKGAKWFADQGDQRRQGPALLVRIGAGEEAGRDLGAGRRDGA